MVFLVLPGYSEGLLMSQRRESQGKGEREEGTDGADKQGGGGGKDDHPRQKKTPGFAGAARFAKKRITGQPRSSSVVKEQDKKHFSPPLPAPSSPLTPPLGAAQPQPRLSWEPWRKISDSQQPIASASVATPPVVLKYQHDNIIVSNAVIIFCVWLYVCMPALD